MPLLYLHRPSGGDVVPALERFLGSGAGLSASTVTRLTEQWRDEHQAFAGRDCPASIYVYCLADGIHVNIRLGEDKLCLLVLIGVRADVQAADHLGRRIPGIDRELGRSAARCQTARDARPGAGRRRRRARVLARAARGFPETREARCWLHKIASCLAALPKSAHPGAKRALAEIWNAEDKTHALAAAKAFEDLFGAKFGKAVAKITDDLDELDQKINKLSRRQSRPQPDQNRSTSRDNCSQAL